MSRKLTKALREQKESTQQVPLEIYGTLGIPIDGSRTVDVPGRPSFVYVRLRDNQNEVIQAFNNKVAASFGLPVIVIREGNRYVIQGVNTQRYQNNWNNNAPYLPKHGSVHSFSNGGGGDVSWIYSRQFMPNLVYPGGGGTTGSYAYIAPHVLLNNSGNWIYTGATGTTNLLSYKGTGSSSAMALIYIDANNGNPGVLVGSGSYFPNSLTGTASVFPFIPTPDPYTQIPLAAVRLDTGTSAVTWDNLYDVRQWIHARPSGTSSGGGGGGIDTIGFAGLANGVPIGTGTILNVQGAGAAFTRSGTVFNLDIPGGSGISTPTYPAIYDDGVFKTTGTAISFDQNLIVSVTGSTAYVSVTGTFAQQAGTYAVTLTNVANISASSVNQDFNYLKIGNMVICSGSIQATHDGSGLGLIRISIPFASDFTTSFDCNGNGTTVAAAAEYAASIIADTTNNEAQIAISQLSTANNTWRIVFMYIIK